MKKAITLIAGLLLLLMFAQCKKDEPVTPNENTDNNGRVEIPIGMSHTDIVVSNFVEDAIPDEDGGFEVGNGRMLMAKNANNGKLIYFSINSIDRNVKNTTENNYELNAKETAIFIAMRLLPTSMMDAPDQSLMNMKSLLYDLPCVKNLETTIQTVVDNYGYLEEEQIKTSVDAIKDYIYEKFMTITGKEMETNKTGSGLVHESLNAPYFSPDKKHGVRVVVNSTNYINYDNDFYDCWKVNCDVQNSLMTMWGFFETNVDGINYIDEDKLRFLPPTGLSNFVDQLISFDGVIQIIDDACNILSDPDYSPEFGKFIVKNAELEFPENLNALRFVGPNSSDKVFVAYIVYDCLYFVDLSLDVIINRLINDGYSMLRPIGIEDLVLGCVADGELVSFIMREKENGADGYRMIANAVLEKANSLIIESMQPDDYASTQIHKLIDAISNIDFITQGFDLWVGAGFNAFANDFCLSFVAEYENQYYPRLLTYEVENIGTNTAQFKGEVFPVQGGLSIIKRGFIYGTEPITTDLNGNLVLCQTTEDELQYDMTGLQAFTYYYVRSYVQLSDGSVFLGNEVGFKTLSAVPILTTYPADEFYITSTTALFEGKVEGVPEESILMRGFMYNTSPQVNINQPGVMLVDAEEGVGLGEFSATVTGLVPGETYYYLAYVIIVDQEPFHGPELSFTTISQTFTITATANPSNGGTVTGGGTFNLGQSCTVTATANSDYTFSNWTENGNAVSTEASYTFTVNDNRTLVANFNANGGSYNGHEYIDLGLPSGALWATCNVGANAPEEYGDYFAWGETQPKSTYNWSTYQYCNGSNYTLVKYCSKSGYGYNGFTDNLTTLLPEDDAATTQWGNGWRTPTKEECEELIGNTTSTVTTINGVKGSQITGPNGNSIFLPYAGGRDDNTLLDEGVYSYFWSSSLNTEYPDYCWGAYYNSKNIDGQRFNGLSVRPVRSTSQAVSYVVNATPSLTEGGTINVTGGAYYGATCTLTATANNGYVFTNWTENGTVVSTNATYSFILTGNRTLVANFTANGGGGGSYNGHDYVDLGLPSGTLWATCNVGANSPEENGDYFAWGETQMKENYVWSTYQHCMGSLNTYTKYCNSSMYGNVDDLTILEPIDDAATSNWGNGWRMPTQAEWEELLQNTTSTATYLNGVRGRYFTATNGNRIFLPCAGQYQEDSYYYDVDGYYWSSSLYLNYAGKAWGLCFDQWNIGMAYKYRSWGWSVRPVRSTR